MMDEMIERLMGKLIKSLHGVDFDGDRMYCATIDVNNEVKFFGSTQEPNAYIRNRKEYWCAVVIVRQKPEKDRTSLDQYLPGQGIPQTINIVKRDIKVRPPEYKTVECDQCNGTGMREVGIAALPTACMTCMGKGQREVARTIICPNCKGRGQVTQLNDTSKCKYGNCNGRGVIDRW